jgi:hypothetical protein
MLSAHYQLNRYLYLWSCFRGRTCGRATGRTECKDRQTWPPCLELIVCTAGKMHVKFKYKYIKTEVDIRTLPAVINFTASHRVLIQYLLDCLFKELGPNDFKASTTLKYDIEVRFIYLEMI